MAPRITILFPGQGVQAPGMDGGLSEAWPDVFALASEVLGVDVPELCQQGRSGDADLSSTRWAQPAVLTCSYASYKAVAERETVIAAAGHSVGEYAALAAGGALDLADALRLIAVRAEATDQAARVAPGSMAAVMRLNQAQVEDICSKAGAGIAAANGPAQFTISGPAGAVQHAVDLASAAGGTCRRLDVAGAFHSPLMASAVPVLEAALEAQTFTAPKFEIWSPTTARPVAEPEEIRQALIDQLTAPVRWSETISALAERHGSIFVDAGPGKVVGALVKRIVQGADVRPAAELVGPGSVRT